MEIMPNFNENPYFDEQPGKLSKHQWPALMLSTATFRYPGSHGSMSGQYSLKVSTRPVANRYEEMPAPGSLGQAIKRISFHNKKRKYLQFEAWFSYTAEQDKMDGTGELPGLHESSIRAFGFGWDLQERGNRYFAGARYLNSVNGELKNKWQIVYPSSKDDEDWAFGVAGDWCVKGIDPFWYGRRYPDGRHDGFIDVKDGHQKLIYNETDCKLNWQYVRVLIDTEERKYVELQSGDQTFDLGGQPIYVAGSYARIETDTNRRVFLYLDSIVISQQ
jgi:hypothetical protein